jgi:hypothetical protein
MSDNPVGRPPKYSTPQEMQEAIDAYFAEIDAHNRDVIGKDMITLMRPYTVTGLAIALDLTRQGLIEYSQKKNGEFSDTLRRAKAKVERFSEEQLYRTGQVTGVIFNLKNNFDWKDKSEVDQNLSGGVAVTQITRTIIDPVNGTEHSNA